MNDSVTLISHIKTVMVDIIYLLDDRSVYRWPKGEEATLFNDILYLDEELFKITTDNQLYLKENKYIVAELDYLLRAIIRLNLRDYPRFLQFGDCVEQVNGILFELGKILYILFDYQEMKKNNEEFYWELNKYVLHPDRIERMASKYSMEFFDYLDAIAV